MTSSGGRAEFDVVVVGSGATGSWAAKQLTEAGLEVALVEAGPLFTNDSERTFAGATRQPIQSKNYRFGPETHHLYVDDIENPYSTPKDASVDWIRSRLVGGRTHTWARYSLRMSDVELKAASRDGHGVDWPLTHADLAPETVAHAAPHTRSQGDAFSRAGPRGSAAHGQSCPSSPTRS